MSAIVTERVIECRSDVCALWGVLTDTDRLNRAMGMERLSVAPIDDASSARYLITTNLGGFSVAYEERPFEWVYPSTFTVVRRMRSGPVSSLEMGWRLASTPTGGTRVTVRLTLEPRSRLLSPLLRLIGGHTLNNLERAVRSMDASLAEAGANAVPVPRRAAHPDALARATDALRASAEPTDLVDRLVAFVRDADDSEVTRIRPFALADDWAKDRIDVLSTCLRAVRAGLLDLRWEIVCPSCRTATDTLPSLASLGEHGECQLCELRFAIDLDEAVEATFAPAKAVREADAGPYCIGGPARTPHVLAQAILPPNGEGRLVAPADEGRYRLFVRGGATSAVDVTKGAPTEVRATSRDGDLLAVAPGGVVIVKNLEADERHAKLERLVWADQGARAHVVTTLPAFRRDFSADVLRPGNALKVSRVGLFFSDLTASTELYAHAGDAAAFKLVHDHFDVVIALVEKHQGTLVKTIGDAVMAVFADEANGLAASLAILHAFEDFRRNNEIRQRTHIKIGVFGGPCYVVTANGLLDYFGQTVNIAARLQGEAKSGEVVVEASLADRAIAAGVLSEAHVRERYEAKLKGVAVPIAAARIRVA